jgi:hypothetical protein
MWERTVFEIVQKSSKFLLEIITLLSFANIMGFHKLFIVGGRSFIYIIKSLGPWIEELPCFTASQSEKNFLLSLDDFILVFCLLLDTIWNILQVFLECHKNVI